MNGESFISSGILGIRETPNENVLIVLNSVLGQTAGTIVEKKERTLKVMSIDEYNKTAENEIDKILNESDLRVESPDGSYFLLRVDEKTGDVWKTEYDKLGMIRVSPFILRRIPREYSEAVEVVSEEKVGKLEVKPTPKPSPAIPTPTKPVEKVSVSVWTKIRPWIILGIILVFIYFLLTAGGKKRIKFA